MTKRYYKNTQYRNICVLNTSEIEDCGIEKGYILAFQSNLTDAWYFFRNEKVSMGDMRYINTATVFSSRVKAIRLFRNEISNNRWNVADPLKYQGRERNY